MSMSSPPLERVGGVTRDPGGDGERIADGTSVERTANAFCGPGGTRLCGVLEDGRRAGVGDTARGVAFPQCAADDIPEHTERLLPNRRFGGLEAVELEDHDRHRLQLATSCRRRAAARSPGRTARRADPRHCRRPARAAPGPVRILKRLHRPAGRRGRGDRRNGAGPSPRRTPRRGRRALVGVGVGRREPVRAHRPSFGSVRRAQPRPPRRSHRRARRPRRARLGRAPRTAPRTRAR